MKPSIRYRNFMSLLSTLADSTGGLPTQTAVAKILGVSLSSINSYINYSRKRGEWKYHFTVQGESKDREDDFQKESDMKRIELARRLKAERCGGYIRDEDMNI
jgi:predicted transcriptional regulator